MSRIGLGQFSVLENRHDFRKQSRANLQFLRRLERELRKLSSTGKSTFASLTASNVDYLQAAGSRAALFVERREAKSGRHFRAYQLKPVVPFEDGTEISFFAGNVKLDANEWFQMRQFVAFLHDDEFPAVFRWREITD